MNKPKGLKRAVTVPTMFYLESVKKNKNEIMKENIPPTTNELTGISLIHIHSKHLKEEQRVATPKKGVQSREDPVTPNTNFKLLTSLAAELDYAKCMTPTSKKQDIDLSIDNNSNNAIECRPNRKEKSLAIICTRFLAMYPLYPVSNISITVSLDEVSVKLGVERRRLYDIVNVFESIDMLSKLVKNKYLWFGKNNLLRSLRRLKDTAHKENVLAKLQYVSDYENSSPVSKQSCILDEVQDFSKSLEYTTSLPGAAVHRLSPTPEIRKEKSLAIMSQKFLMLFLVWPSQVISLGVAAKVLNGFQKNQKGAQIKTQIRRLYDIANVLSSIGLIRKEVAIGHNGRKPAFKYIGPDLEEDLDVIFVGQTKLANNLRKPTNIKPRSLVRHSSFQEICAVAEVEHQKLCLDQTPNSAPPFEKNFRTRDEPEKTDFAHWIDLNNGVKVVNFNKEGNNIECQEKIRQPAFKLVQPQSSNFKVVNVSKQLVASQGPFYILKPGTQEVLKSPTPLGTILLIQPSNVINKLTENVISNQSEKEAASTETFKPTHEQSDIALKSLRLSLSPDQTSKPHTGNSKLPSFPQDQQASLLKNQDNDVSMLKNFNLSSKHKLDTESVESNSLCSSSNTSPNIHVSKFDSPSSGYVTPLSDLSLQSNEESEKHPIKRQENSFLLKHVSLASLLQEKIVNLGYKKSNITTISQFGDTCIGKEVPKFSHKHQLPLQNVRQNSCSGDSVNSEVLEIFKDVKSIPTKPFLIDDKTILSPIKKQKVDSSSISSPFITPPYIAPEAIFVFNQLPLSSPSSKMNTFSFPVSLKMDSDISKANKN